MATKQKPLRLMGFGSAGLFLCLVVVQHLVIGAHASKIAAIEMQLEASIKTNKDLQLEIVELSYTAGLCTNNMNMCRADLTTVREAALELECFSTSNPILR